MGPCAFDPAGPEDCFKHCHENQSCREYNSVFQNYFFFTTGKQEGALSGQPMSFFDLVWPKMESAGSKMWK